MVSNPGSKSENIKDQVFTDCCLNPYFVSANFGELLLFSELALIAAQPMIVAGWFGKIFSSVRQN